MAPDVIYSVVVPVYRNEGSIHRLVATLTELVSQLDGTAELVFVVDGSPDRSLELLEQCAAERAVPIQIVEHSRNFGAFPAIRTGLAAAHGDFMGVIAADLQEPPDLLMRFFELLSTDQADVVVGRRAGRASGDSHLSSSLYWWLYRRLVMPQIPPGGVDVFGINRAARDQLVQLSESSSSLVGQLFWIGYRRLEVPYVRQEREEGMSAWTLRKKLRYLGDSIFSFTALPIQFLTALGAVGLVATVVLSVVVLASWWAGAIPEPGYTPLMLVLLGCTFLIVLALGVVGSYVWRGYENSKGAIRS